MGLLPSYCFLEEVFAAFRLLDSEIEAGLTYLAERRFRSKKAKTLYQSFRFGLVTCESENFSDLSR